MALFFVQSGEIVLIDILGQIDYHRNDEKVGDFVTFY